LQTISKIYQSPVFYARFPVPGLSSEELDAALENGWSRSDVHLTSMLAHPVQGRLRASLMLRLPLRDYTFKKRFSKLLRRNGRVFHTRIRPFQPSEEKEKIWQVFKSKIHNWAVVPDLSTHVFRSRNPVDFQSWEAAVYAGDRLVAFSIFDRGKNSLASLEAAYDPSYAKYSPGIYTMLAEIEFAMQQGMAFYYPGFLPKDTPMFEYKLRLAGLEFFRIKTREWLPWEALEKSDWVFDELVEKLRLLQAFMAVSPTKAVLATGFFLNRPGDVPSLSDYNVFLLCPDPVDEQRDLRIAICWDPFANHFKVFEARLFTNYQDGIFNLSKKMISVYAIAESTCTGSFGNVSEVFRYFPPAGKGRRC
jgi:leucyl-tRNA---protein transferase